MPFLLKYCKITTKKVNMKQNSLFNRFLEALYPSRIKCIVCGCELDADYTASVCPDCYNFLPKHSEKVCLKCGESLDSLTNYCLNCKKSVKRYFSVARAPFLYDGPVIKLIHNLKYFGQKYVGEYLSEFLVEEYKLNNFTADIVVPIPLNPNRLKQRGYNQAETLCKSFEEKLGLKINTTNFIRTIDTPTQTALNKAERKKNLENAFKVVDKNIFKGKTILLIDDVYTTGATLEEASKTLLKSGVKSVICLTLAHTLPPQLRQDYIEE